MEVATVEYKVEESRPFIFSKVVDITPLEESVLNDPKLKERKLFRVWIDIKTKEHITWEEARESKLAYRQIRMDRLEKFNTKGSLKALEQIKQIRREKRLNKLLQ